MATVSKQNGMQQSMVLLGRHDGLTIVSTPTRLTRLNYFDGRLLRAENLRAEQQYLRDLSALSNQAGGPGVVGGLDVSQGSGDALLFAAGLAIDASGRLILLPDQVTVDTQELIDRSSRSLDVAQAVRTDEGDFGDCFVSKDPPPDTVVEGAALYLITVAAAEALCGDEDVYGKLCAEACVTSSERPSIVEGVVFRARPLTLTSQLATSRAFSLSNAHLRSRVASAFYADEWVAGGSLISGAGLRTETWCAGARLEAGNEVPLAVLARTGRTTSFVDLWTARRERMDAPSRRYWAGRMSMRSWPAYLAQVLQFQCQLHDLFLTAPAEGLPEDPCRPHQVVLQDAQAVLADVENHYTRLVERIMPLERGTARRALGGTGVEELPLTRVAMLRRRVQDALKQVHAGPADRVLLRGGIVELPPAGYLPVVPGSTISVNEQVRRLLGEGLDLTFCVVRPDYVAHALEEAQHMERISLVQGLDNPTAKPEVDVLVPNGRIEETKAKPTGAGWEVVLQLGPELVRSLEAGAAAAERTAPEGEIGVMRMAMTRVPSRLTLHGAGRTTEGGPAFYAAGVTEASDPGFISDVARTITRVGSEDLRRYRLGAIEDARNVPLHADPEAVIRVGSVAAAADEALARHEFRPVEEGAEVAPPEVSAETDVGRVASFWLSLSCDHNPFDMSPGESTNVAIRADLASPGRREDLVDAYLYGKFTIDQNHGAVGDDHQVTGRFVGPGSLAAVVGGTRSRGQSGLVELEVTIHRYVSPAGQALLSVELRQSAKFGYLVTARWSADQPLTAEVELDVATLREVDYARRDVSMEELRGVLGTGPASPWLGTHVPLAVAHLKESDDVFRAGNTAHSLALSALKLVGLGLGDATFANTSEQLLFPPPPVPLDTLTVDATTDWVLFHRRRSKQCAPDRPVAPPTPSRTYEVWTARIKNLELLDTVRRVLHSGSAAEIARLGLARVGEVEFAGGLPTLTTPVETVRTAWQAVNPGNRIDYAGIATATGIDGPTVDRDRLTRLEQALAAISPTEAASVAEVLPSVPAPLAVAGTDGVIVLVTRQVAVPTTCHTVFRITELGRGGIAELKKQIETMGLPGFRNERPRVLEELGAVQFRGDETRPFSGDEQVKQQWGARHATAALVVAHRGDEEAGTEALRIVRGEAIADILGGAVTPLPVETRTAPGVDCPVATLVFGVEGEQPPPETVCYEVRGMLADPAGPADIRNALQNKDIATLRTAGNDLGKLVHGGANTVKNLNETDWEVSRRRLLVFAKDMRGFPLADGDEIAHSLGWDQQARPYEVQFEGQAGFPAEATCPFFAFALVDATPEIN